MEILDDEIILLYEQLPPQRDLSPVACDVHEVCNEVALELEKVVPQDGNALVPPSLGQKMGDILFESHFDARTATLALQSQAQRAEDVRPDNQVG